MHSFQQFDIFIVFSSNHFDNCKNIEGNIDDIKLKVCLQRCSSSLFGLDFQNTVSGNIRTKENAYFVLFFSIRERLRLTLTMGVHFEANNSLVEI